jgi:hypothetical protein
VTLNLFFNKKILLFRFRTLERDFQLNFSLNVTPKLRAVENTQKDTLTNSSFKKKLKNSTHSRDRSTVFPPFFECQRKFFAPNFTDFLIFFQIFHSFSDFVVDRKHRRSTA